MKSSPTFVPPTADRTAGPAAMPDHHRMGGERDTASRRGTRQDRSAFRKRSIKILPGVSHVPMIDDPEFGGAHHPRRHRRREAVVRRDRIGIRWGPRTANAPSTPAAVPSPSVTAGAGRSNLVVLLDELGRVVAVVSVIEGVRLDVRASGAAPAAPASR